MNVLGLKIAKVKGTLFVRYEGTRLTRFLGRHTLCRLGFHNKRGWVFANTNVTYCNRCVSLDNAFEQAISKRGSVVLPEKVAR